MQHATYKQCKPSCLPITLARCDGKMSGRKVNGMPTSYTISDARRCVNGNTCKHKHINMLCHTAAKKTHCNCIAPRSRVCNYTKLNTTFFFKLCTHTHLLQINDWYAKYNLFSVGYAKKKTLAHRSVSEIVIDLQRLLFHCCSWAEMLLVISTIALQMWHRQPDPDRDIMNSIGIRDFANITANICSFVQDFHWTQTWILLLISWMRIFILIIGISKKIVTSRCILFCRHYFHYRTSRGKFPKIFLLLLYNFFASYGVGLGAGNSPTDIHI